MENKELIKLKWHTEQRKVDDLIPFEDNPRQVTEKQKDDLQKSLEKFDLVEIPAIDTDNKIVAGHQRLKIMQLLGRGKEIIDVRVPNRKLTDEEFREYNLRSNKNLGEWDYELLANVGEEILLDVGFNKDELDNIFGLETEDSFDVEEEYRKAIKEPKGVKVGDLWQLGEHKLMIGDCTKKEIWEKLLGKERFDFMFTDPPYKLKYTEKKVFKVKTKEGMKLKKKRNYVEVGETNDKGESQPARGFGKNSNRFYEGVKKRGVPEFDEWLSIANEYQNPTGASVMIFENWKNTPELWHAIERYWKMKNMVIWHTPNRCQGFSAKYKFFSKYDIVMLAEKNDPKLIQEYEQEMDDYLEKHGQKLLDTNEVILYGNKGKSNWSKVKGTRWARMNDHITSSVETGSGSGQSIIFGTKPIQILVPYIKILSPRGGGYHGTLRWLGLHHYCL